MRKPITILFAARKAQPTFFIKKGRKKFVICSFVPLLHYGFSSYKVVTLLSLNSVNLNLSDHITWN